MKPLSILFGAACVGLLTLSAQADRLSIPVGQQVGSGLGLPERGTSSNDVLRQRGEPVRRHPAVGQPPISRWEYGNYSVYFEGDRVIHSVSQHRPRSGD